MFIGISNAVTRLQVDTGLRFLFANGEAAGYGLDLTNERYFVDRVSKSFADAVTHTRAGNATMVDSDGTMKWAPHNLLTYSEQFDDAVWDKGGETLIANDAVAPDGTQTADKLVADGTSKNHRCRQIVSTNINTSYSFGVWVKNVDATAILVTLTYSGAAGYYHTVVVDPADWTISQKSTGANSTEISSAVTEGVDGWALVKITAKSNSGYAFNNAAVSLVDATTGNNFATIGTGYITSTEDGSAYIWGAHLYRSDLGGMVDVPSDARAFPSANTYVPTTSAARYLPRRGHHVWNGSEWVKEGLLLESEARTNLLTYSVPDAAEPTDWTDFVAGAVGKSLTTLSNGLTGIRFQSSGDRPRISQNVAVSPSTTYTLSVYVEPGWDDGGLPSQNILRLLSDGTSPALATAKPSDIGADGFVYISVTTPADATSLNVQYGPGINDNRTGDDITMGGIQLEAGSTPSSYIPTSGSQATRAAETLEATSANLPWPEPEYVTGEELVTNGTFDTDTDWAKGAGWTISGGVASNGPSTTTTDYLEQTLPLVDGALYEVSFTISNVSGSTQAGISGTGAFGSAASSDRFISTNGTKTFFAIYSASDGTSLRFVGTGPGATFDIDNISVKEINPLAVSLQMKGRMTYADQDSIEVEFVKWREDGDTQVYVFLNTVASRSGAVQFLSEAEGVIDLVESASLYSPNILVPFNIASRHGSTFINGAVDGTALTADTTPVALPDLSSTDLQIGYNFMGTISEFRVWAADLGDAGIVEASS